jgi:hypothetical protein
MQCQPLDEALHTTATGCLQLTVLTLLNEPSRSDPGHDLLAQIAAEPVPATLAPVA